MNAQRRVRASKPLIFRGLPGFALACALTLAAPAQAASSDAPGNAELYEIIKALQAEVQSLRTQLDAERRGEADQALQEQVEAQQAQIDALAELADAAQSAPSKVHFGAYGEMHYQNLSADDPSFDVEELDFHRFVLYTGYDFSDRIRFVSELEVEHAIAGDGEAGEVELEQAYLEFDINDRLTARGGVILVPAGIINETHEPTTFYGVERNDVEGVIIPSTWWAGGAAVSLRFAPGLQWDLMVHEGLKVPVIDGNAFAVRSGRQKTSEATASDLAYTTRLRYTGVSGLELAASLQYQTDPSQIAGDGLDDGLMYTAHAIWSRGPFAVRALYAGWQLSGDAVERADVERQSGWYIEPSLRVLAPLGVYARFEDVEGARLRDRFSQWEAGLNYYPHPQVVLKADFRIREHDLGSESARDFNGFDLGLGYNF